MIQLVKAFLRLLTVGDEFNGFDVGGGHKTSVLLFGWYARGSTLG